MKRFSLFLFSLILSFSVSVRADISNEDLYALSIDELLSLQNQISVILQEKGYAVYTDISHGDKGDNVVKLQEHLSALGYYHGKITGKYDSETEKSVKKLQKDNGLEVNGIATQSLQILLYSENLTSIATPTPRPTSTPAPTEDPALSMYLPIEYNDCARYPEKYSGTKVKISGTVVQVMGSKKSGFNIRLATSGFDDIFYISLESGIVDYNILEDDKLIVYGTMNGSYTYRSTLGKSITLPYVLAEAIMLR